MIIDQSNNPARVPFPPQCAEHPQQGCTDPEKFKMTIKDLVGLAHLVWPPACRRFTLTAQQQGLKVGRMPLAGIFSALMSAACDNQFVAETIAAPCSQALSA